jgi:hypothetical protein
MPCNHLWDIYDTFAVPRARKSKPIEYKTSRYTHFYSKCIQHTYKEARMTNKSSTFADFHRGFHCISPF